MTDIITLLIKKPIQPRRNDNTPRRNKDLCTLGEQDRILALYAKDDNAAELSSKFCFQGLDISPSFAGWSIRQAIFYRPRGCELHRCHLAFGHQGDHVCADCGDSFSIPPETSEYQRKIMHEILRSRYNEEHRCHLR